MGTLTNKEQIRINYMQLKNQTPEFRHPYYY